MKKIATCCFVLVGLLFVPNGLSQSIAPKASFHVNVGLPINLRNESFKGIMQGLVSTSAHFQYTLKNSLSFGVGVNYSYFSLNEFKVTEKINGRLQMPSAFIKIGQEKFHSEVFGTDVGLKMGYTANIFNSDSIQKFFGSSQKLYSLYVEPNLGFMLLMDESTTFKFFLGYSIQNFGFRPSYLGLTSNNGYDPENFNKKTQYLTIGFGYTHYFKNNK